MFNPLPLLALGVVAAGYAGAVDNLRSANDLGPDANPSIVAFAAAPNLSVQGFVGQLPQSIQDPLCDDTDVLTASLADDFAETFESTWMQQQQVSMELWASELMGTWTLLQVQEDGLACIVASGFGWTDGMGVQDVVPDRPLS
ncbi:MAG: hypothetical protein U0934_13040 [Pseudotabrizicola sp.]|uniref:hypothetical protein n=1 Tax=Pseudotabrizicola sp. TaxID=2939647 RepID=UPI00271C0516|nr:hypothetical protein [Pseudotabrizicola sp.]MDO8882773.1 hypothetical protein [Pseudotabrizicola sp.]MDP2083431.1 hypothetical protein [Pseudotabrizicola sp.]MDZ7574865.1 hypothetical protein [Pseudotabrizicola sp.]